MSEDLDPIDRAALALATDLTLRTIRLIPGRVQQVTEMLAERDWFEVASFCGYHQQMSRLHLGPHQSVVGEVVAHNSSPWRRGGLEPWFGAKAQLVATHPKADLLCSG